MLELNKIYQCDCLEGMKLIGDKSIDMILCDLPYGTTKCKWDIMIPFDLLWEQYKRIIKNNGAIVLTATQPFTSILILSNINWYKHSWVWDKVKPNGHLVVKFRPMQRTEDIVVFCKNSPKYNPQMTQRDVPKRSKEYGRTSIMGGEQTDFDGKILNEKYPQNVIVISNASQVGKVHPTQKPVSLFEYLIKTYTNEEDLVLDNCAGSFTTFVACDNLRRKSICMEKEQKYCEIGLDRVNENRVFLDLDQLTTSDIITI